jgi:transcriptional regulator
MYRPEPFVVDDPAVLLAHARDNPFATVLTVGRASAAGASPEPAVSHLPVLVDATRGVLRGHLARENRQIEHFAAEAAALVIFHGPHGYVSPSVYETHPSVPTWNYVVVHIHGQSRLVGEAALRAILDDTVARFDPTGWRLQAPDEYWAGALGAIAGFEITIGRVEGKWKLSQNRSLEDQGRAAAWLERGDAASRAAAAIMRQRLR